MPNAKTGSHRPLPESAAQSLATALRARREAAGLTQEDLASTAQISVQAVRRIEAATANPTLGTLYAVASALDVSWTDFILEVGD